MFIKFWLSIIFMALVISGPTANPGEGSAGACPAAQMGIVADEDFVVADLVARSPAQVAGVQRADVLLDLTLISVGEPFVCNDTGPASGGVLPPRDVSFYPTGPVAFTEQDAIRTLTDYGLTLRLRVLRDGQTIELTVKPDNIHRAVTPGAPTATPIPATPTFYFF